MNARKSLAITAVVAVAALGLAACSSNGGGDDTPTGGATTADGGTGGDSGTLTVWENNTNGDLGTQFWDWVKTEYAKAQPGITLNIVPVQNEDMDGKLQTSLGGADAPNAFFQAGGGKLAVGVDSDQATIFADTDPAQADVIFTSVEKKVGESLYLALKATVEGTQEYGKREMLGLKDGAVGISKNAQYEKLVPADLRAEVDAIEAKIVSGEIAVDTDMD